MFLMTFCRVWHLGPTIIGTILFTKNGFGFILTNRMTLSILILSDVVYVALIHVG